MFYVIIIFIAAQIFFMYKGVETIPFYLLSMYSTRSYIRDTTYQAAWYVNGKKLDATNLPNREMETLLGSFDYYQSLKRRNFIATDTATIQKRFKNILSVKCYETVYNRLTNNKVNDNLFLNWWIRYLSKAINKKVDSVAVVRSSIIVWKPAFKEIKDSTLFFKYAIKGS